MTETAETSRFGVLVTSIPAVACLLAVSGVTTSMLLAVGGLSLALFGTVWGSRRFLGTGVGALFAGVLLAGMVGYRPSLLAIAGVGALLTWDFGDHVIGLARHLGSDADSRRIVLVHAISNGVVAVGALGVVVLGFSVAPRDYPLLVVVLLLAALLALVYALRLGR